MNTEHCAELTDAKRIELKSGLAEPKAHPDSGFVVPAGILIGLGVGLLADHLFSGFLVGLGLGLIAAELLAIVRKSRNGERIQAAGANVTTLLIGAFLAFTGISFVWAPIAVWPYALAGFLILTGILFLVRGFARAP
jgi:F0F1-type ATP synthase assembly protein I